MTEQEEAKMRKLEEENKRLSAKVASLMDALAWLRKRVVISKYYFDIFS